MILRSFNLPMSLILHILYFLSRKFRRKYSFPSQNKLLYILKRYYGTEICRRSLNYHLAYLEYHGYIKRLRRIKRGPTGGLVFQSSLYWLRKKGFGFITKLASTMSRAGLRVKKWWKKEGRPFSPEERAAFFNQYGYDPDRGG